MWYTFLGVVQYTFWEVLYIHCCATNRLPFVSNQQTFSDAWNFTMFCLAAFWVPLYREIHFYFSHRLIHIKALYKYIHSVHHRNTDIEPFAGLSMHPVEHLYYYSCVGPSLLIFGTPFAFMWMGLHLILSPAGDVIYKYFLLTLPGGGRGGLKHPPTIFKRYKLFWQNIFWILLWGTLKFDMLCF